MSQTAAERLKIAREAAKYDSASSAARAMGIPEPTYLGHENGSGGLARAGERYARFFRVSLDWLLSGRGDMRGGMRIIPVDGLIRCARVEDFAEGRRDGAPVDVEIPTDCELAAFMVKGAADYPRFLDGEFVLYDKAPLDPKELVDQLAVVQTLDGRRLVKTLRAYGGGEVWRLESHNAPPEDARLKSAWRYVGVLARPRAKSDPAE